MQPYLIKKTAVLRFTQRLCAEQNLLHFAVQIYPVGPSLSTAQIKAVPVPVRGAAVAQCHCYGSIEQGIEVLALHQQVLHLRQHTSGQIDTSCGFFKRNAPRYNFLCSSGAYLAQYLPVGVAFCAAGKDKGVGFFVALTGVVFHIQQQRIKFIVVFEHPSAFVQAPPKSHQTKPQQQ